VFRGRISWRKLSVLVNGLPQHSRTVTWQIDQTRDQPKRKPTGPAPTARWGEVEHLVADCRELLAGLQHTLIAVNSEKGKRPKTPKPFPRPTDRRPLSPAEKQRVFDELVSRTRFADQQPAEPSDN
jgi:hypothetical protein